MDRGRERYAPVGLVVFEEEEGEGGQVNVVV